ncbi:MAG: GNAT family N-acetyltransferase [Planctomycetes bacterium]|nr:GNAT family N-acetyltransferase [Planctomycetota bacterium]
MSQKIPRFHMRAQLGQRERVQVDGMRTPKESDIPDLAMLMLAAYQGTVDDKGETLDDATKEIQKTFAGEYGPLNPECSKVVESGGVIFSATLVTRWKDRPFIAFSMTAPIAKRKGLARAGLINAMQDLVAQGEREVHLVVTRTNIPAIALYQDLGFVKAGGPLLENSGREHITKLQSGVFWIMASIVVKVLPVFIDYTTNFGPGSHIKQASNNPSDEFELIWDGLRFMAVMMSTYGLWRLSTPSPVRLSADNGSLRRRLLRIGIVITGINSLAWFLSMTTPLAMFPSNAFGPEGIYVAILLVIVIVIYITVVSLATFGFALLYIRWLADRIPNVPIKQLALYLIWIGIPLCLWDWNSTAPRISTLLAMTIYFILLILLRRELNGIVTKIDGEPGIAPS